MGDISIVAGDDKSGWFSLMLVLTPMLTLVMHRSDVTIGTCHSWLETLDVRDLYVNSSRVRNW